MNSNASEEFRSATKATSNSKMHFINISQLIVSIAFLSALATNPVFAIPTPNSIISRQDTPDPIPKPAPIITTTRRSTTQIFSTKISTKRPQPTLCPPSHDSKKRQEGNSDGTGSKILPPICPL